MSVNVYIGLRSFVLRYWGILEREALNINMTNGSLLQGGSNSEVRWINQFHKINYCKYFFFFKWGRWVNKLSCSAERDNDAKSPSDRVADKHASSVTDRPAKGWSGPTPHDLDWTAMIWWIPNQKAKKSSLSWRLLACSNRQNQSPHPPPPTPKNLKMLNNFF